MTEITELDSTCDRLTLSKTLPAHPEVQPSIATGSTVQQRPVRSRYKPTAPPKWNSYAAILRHATTGGIRSFLIAFALRGGVTFAIRLFRVFRRKQVL